MTRISTPAHVPGPAAFSCGPSRLQLMPADQKEALDPYMAQIVTDRKSGLSLNHIIGCPLDCGYCVRHFWGDFEHKTPHLLCPTDEAIGMLLGHEAFRPSTTPIQLFNKATDPFLPGVKPHLFQILQALDDRGLDNLVLVITRFKVTAADMAQLERLRHVRVTLLFTYSGIADPRIEPIAKSTITTTSIATACAHKDRTKVVLYWRPIVPGWNDQPETMGHVLTVGDRADAIVFTGYYHKEQNAVSSARLASASPTDTSTTGARCCPPSWTPRSWRPGASQESPPRCSARPVAAFRSPTASRTTTGTGASANCAASVPRPSGICARPSTASPLPVSSKPCSPTSAMPPDT